ncbi:Cytochrome P450 monooxygenase TRI4 [Lachnellula suecica]|uniref:Cytochrome P450 monooxygenase TRI4 n=1 Tax=Lachnellula suecica TaxID=602035 RepID=A0A8T9CKW9_9HELO|nr:Cytochrome P450 monooxygenase TRI4 [Lachnellula suecica]
MFFQADMFALPSGSFSTIPHDLHRRRRAMFSHHFSTAAVHKLEPLLREKVDLLLARLESTRETGEPVSLWHAYTALVADIITAYCFPESYNLLAVPDYSKQMLETFTRISLGTHMIKHCPWMIHLLRALPQWLARWVHPDLELLVDMQVGFANQVLKVKEKRANSNANGDESEQGHVFDSMLNAEVPESEKSIERLAHEAQTVVMAGMMTTAHSLMTITYHVLANPHVLVRLIEKLSTMSSGPAEAAPLSALEK